MKRILFLAGLVMLLASSCKLTKYDRYPGTRLTEFPAEVQGVYLLRDHKGGDDSKDTNYMRIKAKSIDISDAKLKTLLNLNDTNIVSSYKDFYFFSTRTSDDSKHEWFVYPFKIKKGRLFVYTISSGKIQKKLEKYLKLQPDNYNRYTMDDEQFYKFCRKKLKKRHSFELVKVNKQ